MSEEDPESSTPEKDINSESLSHQSDHYFYEDFKFINYLKALIHSYLDNFDINIEKYISRYLTCDLRYAIHEELKKVYVTKTLLNKISKEKLENYFKKGILSNPNINTIMKQKQKRLSSPTINNYKYKPKTN